MPVFQYTDQEAENLINNVYLGNVNPNNLPLDLYLAINLYLSSAVDTVFGAESMLEIGAPDYELTRYYKHNIALFSGAKTYQQAKDMSDQLFTADGMKREFSAFRRDADEIFNTYNKNWLRTEYDTAIGQAQTGSLWLDIERDKEALPYLRYITAGDERVRQEHKAWDGITLPVDHPFWDNHMPLNGWNCRCNVMQLSEFEATGVTSDDDLKDLPEPEELFKGNPAKTKELFDKKHPYFVVPAKDKERLKNNFGFPTPDKPKEPIVNTQETRKVKRTKNLEKAESNELEFIKTLKENEKRALFEYTSNGYIDINGYLRGREEMKHLGSEKTFLKLVNDLEKTIEKSPKYEGLTHRLIKFDDRKKFDEFMKNLNKGGVFVEKGFMSTSIEDLSKYMDGKYRVKMEIEGKNGVLLKEMSINPDENEILFNKGTSFEVKDIIKRYDYEFEEQAEYVVKLKEVIHE